MNSSNKITLFEKAEKMSTDEIKRTISLWMANAEDVDEEFIFILMDELQKRDGSADDDVDVDGQWEIFVSDYLPRLDVKNKRDKKRPTIYLARTTVKVAIAAVLAMVLAMSSFACFSALRRYVLKLTEDVSGLYSVVEAELVEEGDSSVTYVKALEDYVFPDPPEGYVEVFRHIINFHSFVHYENKKHDFIDISIIDSQLLIKADTENCTVAKIDINGHEAQIIYKGNEISITWIDVYGNNILMRSSSNQQILEKLASEFYSINN